MPDVAARYIFIKSYFTFNNAEFYVNLTTNIFCSKRQGSYLSINMYLYTQGTLNLHILAKRDSSILV